MPLPVTALGWILLFSAVLWSLREAAAKSPSSKLGWKWWLLLAGVLLLFRWPILWVRQELNPDESQLITGALTLRYDPVFWRSVEGGSAGPLDHYPLLAAAWTQSANSYAIARLLALAGAFGTLLFAGETLALIAGATAARAATLPALAFYAFTRNPEFAHYSTEVVPVFLLAAAGFVIVRQAATPSRAAPWIIGLLLGAVPWAKLQGVPLGAALGALALAQEISSGRFRSVSALIISALLPTLVIGIVTELAGQTEYALKLYFLNAAAYVKVNDYTLVHVVVSHWRNAVIDGQLALWIAGAIGFALFAPALAGDTPHPLRRKHVIATGLLGLAILCVLFPRRPFGHYLLLTIWPLTLTLGTSLAIALQRTSAPTRRSLLVVGLFIACAFLPQVAHRAFGKNIFANFNAYTPDAEARQLVDTLKHYTQPGEKLSVWGWRSSLYVEAGLRQATRQVHTAGQITFSPKQSFFLRTYLDELMTSNPPVFADAVGPGNFMFQDRANAHEAVPALGDWIAANYTLVADLAGTRLYVRNDRFKTRPPNASRS